MNAVSHPDKQILADYATGKLAEDEASTVARHLTECPECESTIQALEARSETLVSGLGDKAPSEPYAGETELRRAVEKVAKNPTGAKPQVDVDKVSTKGPVKLGPYQLLAKLGEGGMGAVFKARHEHLDKIVAIKVLPKKAMVDPAAVARFRREMKAVGALHHPNIVGAHDAGEAQGVHFLVMEYVAGSDLSSLIKKSGPVTVEQAVSYMTQAAKGLAFAHAKNIVHRDIKPANLLVDGEGTVKILDMGLARLDDGGAANAEANQGLTQTGQVMGTVDYMAPEQAFDTHRADAKADVYSLGCTLYRILTGENAFRGDTVVQKILAHREQPIPSLVKLCPQAPAALDALYQRMLAKTPDGRPTMAEVVKELDALAANPQATESSGPSIAIDVTQKKPVSREAKPSAKPQAKRDAGRGKKPPVKLIAAGLGGFAIISLGVLLYFGDTEVEVPDGATAKIDVDAAGKPQVRITMPSAAPTPAVAKPVPTSSKPPVSFFGDHASTSISKPTEFQGNRYQVFKDVVDWKQAKQRCESQGGHLAVVRSAEEQAFLVALLKSAGMDAAWIGATDSKKEGDWLWVDGTKVTFADWDKGQPNNKPPGEHYAAIVLNFQGTWLNGRWSDQPAVAAQHSTIGYVCQWDAPPSSAAAPPPGNYALSFDGDDETKVSVPSLKLPVTGPLTIEGFYTPQDRALKSGQNPALVGTLNQFIVTSPSAAGRMLLAARVDKQTSYVASQIPHAVGSRAHFAAVRSGDKFELFIDGKRAAVPVVLSGPLAENDSGLGMGPAHGLLDEVRISKTARYEDEFTPVDRHEPDADTLALYHCDEGAGDVLIDASGNGHDGKIVAATWVRTDGSAIPPPAPESQWSVPENLGPIVNTPERETFPALSGDGLMLVFSTSSSTNVGGSSGDIWSTRRATIDAPWEPPVKLGSTINTTKQEITPCLSADGLTLMFMSDRPGGVGDDDLWQSTRLSTNDPWSPAVNLGPVVNSAAGDDSPFFSRDGLTLWFASNRPGGAGGYDIWQAMRPAPNDPFGPPVNLGARVNTAADEADPAVSPDGRELLISVRPPNSPKTAWDLKIASRSGDGWSAPLPLTPLNSPHEEFGGEFTPDGEGIIFHSRRPGGQGADDLWYSRRMPSTATRNPSAIANPPKFTNAFGMEFVLVSQGKSWLGGGDGKPGEQEHVQPHDFYLGAYEVTQQQWQAVMGTNNSYHRRNGGGKTKVEQFSDDDLQRFPVETVTWDDALRFVAKLNATTNDNGWTYRLPTEAEWEYACRGGPMTSRADSQFSYYFDVPTNSQAPDKANYGVPPAAVRPSKVGSYSPNKLELFDMHGNVQEWCDGSVVDAAGGIQRVLRGGSFSKGINSSQAADRFLTHSPNDRIYDHGLRVARVPVTATLVPPGGGAITPPTTAPGLVREFPGHTNDVRGVAFLPGGKEAVSFDGDRFVRRWNVETGAEVEHFELPRDHLRTLMPLPDGRRFVASHWTDGMDLWTWEGKQAIRKYHGWATYLSALAPDGRQFATLGLVNGEPRIDLWDLEQEQRVRTVVRFPENKPGYASLAFGPAGRILSGHQGELAVWDAETGRNLWRIAGAGWFHAVAASADGKYFAAGKSVDAKAGYVIVFDAETGAELHRWSHAGTVHSVLFTPDGRHVLSSGTDKTIHIGDVATGQTVHRFTADTFCVMRMAVSPDGRYLFTGGGADPNGGDSTKWPRDGDYALRLWQLPPSVWTSSISVAPIADPTAPLPAATPAPGPYELLTSPDYEWSGPVKVSDMAKLPAVSGDGLSLVSVAGAAAPVGGNDLFIAERKTLDVPFGANANLGPTINSESHDSYPWLSADGLTLIFSSERSGGVGNNDLWTTTRPARGEPFGPPTPFEVPVNTVNQETGGALSADGRTLVFASTRGSATGAGDSDLWQCRRKDSQSPFEKPESLGPAVNSPLAELRPWLSADGRVLCFGSAELTKDAAGRNAHVSGSHQIWFAVRPSVDAPFGERQPLGPPIAVPGSIRTSPSLSADGTLLFFESKRTDADHELWMSRRVPKSANAKGIVRPQISVDPDRTFAEWALAGKAQVVVVRKDDKSNKDIYARVPEELPAEPFWVVQFGVNPAWTPSTERKRFTDETVERLTGLKLLRRVEYYDAGLTDAGVARLATVTTLTSVTARDMKLTDDAFLPLLELPNVESISTTGVQITDRLLEAAAKKPSLKRLGVTTCDQLTDAGLEALVAKNDWERLDIGSPYFRPYKFTDAGLLKLAALKSLQVLNIQGLGKRSTFEALHKALPDCDIYWRLYELNFHVGKVPTKTCSLRVVLAKTGQELTITADQRAPSGLADSDLTRIVEINMTDDREFSGPNVGWLLSELTDVEVLVVDGTGVTDKELPAIEAMSGLKQVSLKRTKVTAAGVTKLQQALPKCTISWDGALQKTAAARQITTLDDPAYQAWLKAAQALPAEQQLDAVSKKLMELNAGFDGKLVGYGTSWTDIPPKIEKGAVLDVGLFTDQIEDLAPLQVFSNARRVLCCGSNPGKGRLVDLSPLAGLPLTNLSCANNPISDLTPLADMPLKGLICNGTAISDIAPLAGLPLIEVRLHSTSVSDLTPLKGMKLSILYCYDTPVSDLAPLAGMPLTALNCSETPVSDLTPLKGMSLTYLWLHDTPVSDLTPLAGMPLKSLRFTPANVSRGIETIRAMTTVADLGLKHQAVGGGVYTPAEFWKKYDAGEFASPNAAATPAWQSPEFEQWIKSVRAVPADKQLDAVSKKLMERNPGFDGVLTSADGKGPPKIENGVVTEVRFLTDNVADIAPVRALAGLKALNCSGSGKPQAGNGLLADLAPLTGLALTSLEFNDTKAADLSPLAGMPLVRLSCFHTRVGDLKPLQGMKLTYISFHGSSRVTDLSPLRGMPLTFLSATHTNLTDVTPLASCPTLISVNLSSTKVSAEAVDALQQALPKCKIYWSARTSGNGVD